MITCHMDNHFIFYQFCIYFNHYQKKANQQLVRRALISWILLLRVRQIGKRRPFQVSVKGLIDSNCCAGAAGGRRGGEMGKGLLGQDTTCVWETLDRPVGPGWGSWGPAWLSWGLGALGGSLPLREPQFPPL